MREARPELVKELAALRLFIEEVFIMSPKPTIVPRIDAPPEHTCGTWFRAGVLTRGCPGCATGSAPSSAPIRPTSRTADQLPAGAVR
jgi:hypothetical protein